MACLLFLTGVNNVVVATFSLIGGLAVTSILLSLPARIGLGWDEGSVIVITFIVSSLALGTLMKQRTIAAHYESATPTAATYLLSIPFAVVSLLLGTFLRSTPAQKFEMLAPEDNASWIHAASGFVRFGATATGVSDQDYGLNGAGSFFVSLVSELTTGGMINPPSHMALSVVLNSYVVTLFLLMLSTASAVILTGNQIQRGRHIPARQSLLLPAAAAAASVFSVLLASPHVQMAGHFTLVLSTAVILGFLALLQVVDDFNVHTLESNDSAKATIRFIVFVVCLCMTSVIASIWFPLTPVMLVVAIHLLSKYLRDIKPTSDLRRHISEWVTIVLVLLASTRLVRVPVGDFSAAEIVNAAGGVIQPSTPIFALGVVCLLIMTVSDPSLWKTDSLGRLRSAIARPTRQVLVSGLIIVFILLWAYSMIEFPKFPGYSTIKFGVLLYLIGFPLIFALLALLEGSRIVRSAPVTLVLTTTFGLSLMIGGPNEMIRRDTAVKFPNSWMGTLLTTTNRERASLVLCFNRPDELVFEAYLCTRFAAALQFKEHEPLARFWRFQLLDSGVSDVETPIGEETCGVKPWDRPYCVDKRVGQYLATSRKLSVLMFPKDDQWWTLPNPFDDSPWAAVLPWGDIRLVEGGVR